LSSQNFQLLTIKIQECRRSWRVPNIQYVDHDVLLVTEEDQEQRSTGKGCPNIEKGNTTSINNQQVLNMICQFHTRLSRTQKIQLISCLFKQYIKEIFEINTGFVPKSFFWKLQHLQWQTLTSMAHLSFIAKHQEHVHREAKKASPQLLCSREIMRQVLHKRQTSDWHLMSSVKTWRF